MRYVILVLFFLTISGVCASNYSIDFKQVGDKLIVSEGNNESFVSEGGLDKVGPGYYFIKRIESAANYDFFSVRLDLEEGIVANSGEIFPSNYVFSSDGRTISLVWNYTNVSKGDVFAFFVSMEDKKISSHFWAYFAVFIVLIFGLATYWFLRRKRAIVDKYLLDEERKVIEILNSVDRNEMWQKNIQKSMNLSKAKCSRMIRNLESRGLVEKIPMGNTNKIRLK